MASSAGLQAPSSPPLASARYNRNAAHTSTGWVEEEAEVRALKFRICNVLKLWMDKHFEYDFKPQPALLQVLITFIIGKLIREGRDTLANILKTSIYNQVNPYYSSC